MRRMLAICTPAIIGIACMALTYDGKAQETPKPIPKTNTYTYQPTKAGAALIDLLHRESEPAGMQLDDGEVNILLQIAAAEADTQGVTGQALVMRVVLNRMEIEEFPDSIYEIVYQCSDGVYQFLPVKDGTLWNAKTNSATYEALEMVLSGWDESHGATYFCSPEASEWHDRDLQPLFQYGCHKFYKEWEVEK